MRNPLPEPVRTAKGYSGLSVPRAPGTDALTDRAFLLRKPVGMQDA